MGVGASAQQSEFCSALHLGETPKVQEYLVNNYDLALDSVEPDGGTAWHILAREGKLELMATVYAYVMERKTLCFVGKMRPRQALAKMELLMNCRDAAGHTPLTLACMGGHHETVSWLLTKGSDPWAKIRRVEGAMTALHFAVKSGSKECVNALLTFVNANQELQAPRMGSRFVDAMTCSAITPLHYAAWYNDPEMVSILIAQGAVLSRQCWFNPSAGKEEVVMDHRSTPLHVAARLGAADVIRQLLMAYAVRFPASDANDTTLFVGDEALDPRRIPNSANQLPIHIALRYRHHHLEQWLDPATPLHDIANSTNPNDRLLGPPKLVQIVGPIAQKWLLAEIAALTAIDELVEAPHELEAVKLELPAPPPAPPAPTLPFPALATAGAPARASAPAPLMVFGTMCPVEVTPLTSPAVSRRLLSERSSMSDVSAGSDFSESALVYPTSPCASPSALRPCMSRRESSESAGVASPSTSCRSLAADPDSVAAILARRSTSSLKSAPRRTISKTSTTPSQAFDRMCGVCMSDEPDFLSIKPCSHRMCVDCCTELVKISTFKAARCPFCRHVILGFANQQ